MSTQILQLLTRVEQSHCQLNMDRYADLIPTDNLQQSSYEDLVPTNNAQESSYPDLISTTPKDIQVAESKDLPINPNTQNTDYKNWCQAFVEQVTGSGWKGGTAFEAWQNQQNKAVQGTAGIKPGDVIYFTPTADNQAGHTGIYEGKNKFISATDNGVEVLDLKDWQKSTGQKILGYVPVGGRN